MGGLDRSAKALRRPKAPSRISRPSWEIAIRCVVVDTVAEPIYVCGTMSQKTNTGADVISYKGVTYPWQCDQIGHMNITFYVAKFDEANWNLFASIGITPSYLREGKFGVAGVQQNITYKRELLAGDVIEIGTRILEIREKVIRFLHEMRNVESREIAAICDITAVHMDRSTRKSCPFPETVRKNAEARITK
jgi:acyl-CoA thioester hydrolase